MAFSPDKMQAMTHKLISKTPDGYRSPDKIIAKIQEEKDEVCEAKKEYLETPRCKTFNHLKTEFGDLLYAICCLANSYGKECISKKTELWKIDLLTIFDQTQKKYLNHSERESDLHLCVEQLVNEVSAHPENIDMIKKKTGDVLVATFDFAYTCQVYEDKAIDLNHAFALAVKKNTKRLKMGYQKK